MVRERGEIPFSPFAKRSTLSLADCSRVSLPSFSHLHDHYSREKTILYFRFRKLLILDVSEGYIMLSRRGVISTFSTGNFVSAIPFTCERLSL